MIASIGAGAFSVVSVLSILSLRQYIQKEKV